MEYFYYWLFSYLLIFLASFGLTFLFVILKRVLTKDVNPIYLFFTLILVGFLINLNLSIMIFGEFHWLLTGLIAIAGLFSFFLTTIGAFFVFVLIVSGIDYKPRRKNEKNDDQGGNV
jgi:hypothetical protein